MSACERAGLATECGDLIDICDIPCVSSSLQRCLLRYRYKVPYQSVTSYSLGQRKQQHPLRHTALT